MIIPKSEAELAEQVARANGPICVRGGGTRPIGAPVEGDVLSTSGLSGITLYEPGALTIVAQAGTPLAEIRDVLAKEGQRLPFEPMDHRELLGTEGVPTIGGVVAGNISGPRRISVGACRDFLLGVRFVDGRGDVIKNGGRVMKNVTGYDLVKVLAGSWGTLGILSEVSFKVLPVSHASATLTLDGLSVAQAVLAMSAALGSPFEVTGAAHSLAGTKIRIEGFQASVLYRAEALCQLLSQFGKARVDTDEGQNAKLWQQIRDVEPFHAKSGDVWRISVAPSDATEMVARLQTEDILLDWGGGLIWALLPEGTDARARLGVFNGHATLIRASDATREIIPVFHPEPAPIAALAKALRARFDPRGIFNQGIMGRE